MTRKQQKNREGLKMGGAKISDQVSDYSNHPFFVKKDKEARAFIEKVGLPKELLQKP